MAARLHLLFDRRVEIDLARLAAILAEFDPALEAAKIEMDLETRIADATFGDFHMRFRAVGEAIPELVLEPALQLAHLDPEEKAAARAHTCFVVIEHVPVEGLVPRTLDQFRAVAILAAAFARLGATFLVHLDARTVLPAGAFMAAPADVIPLIEGLSPLLLFMGFAKYELALPPDLPNLGLRHAGVWMRTHGGVNFGVPDLARLTDGHEEGLATFRAMTEMVVHMIESRAVFSIGDVVQLPDGALGVFRAPKEDEAFLEGEHPVLVLDPLPHAEPG
ncbi:MAG: hypothetical protein U0414_35220 [Polyangiaceae bacterium]